MYCTTCELEIKGDDKKSCPVCGSQLSDSHEADSSLTNQDQQQSAAQDIFADTSSGEPDQELLTGDSLQEDAFVLKDYESDSSPLEEGVDSQHSAASDALQDIDGQPLQTGPSQTDAESVNDVLDSIRESIAASEPSGEASGSAGEDSLGLDADFAFFDNVDTEPSAEISSDSTAEQKSDVSWGFDEAAAAVSMPVAPERKRSLAPKIILIILLLAVGCYYAFTRLAGDVGPDDTNVALNMMPSDSRQSESGMQLEQELLNDSSVDATVPVVVDGSDPQSVKTESQQSPAVALQTEADELVETATPIAQAAGQADTDIKIESGQAVVDESAETAAPVVPEALPVSAQAAARADTESKTERAQVAVEDSTETATPVAPEVVSVSAQAAAQAETDIKAGPAKLISAPFFTVHVGSYQKRSSAASEVDRIKAKDHDAFIERVDLGKRGIWYRVKVGRFKTRAEAEQLQKKINKVLVSDSMVVTQRTN